MRTYIVDGAISAVQKDLYKPIQSRARANPFIGVVAFPFVIGDVCLDTIRPLLITVEKVAGAVLNILGWPFDRECSVKDAIINFQNALCNLSMAPVYLAMIPIKLIYQLGVTALYPATTNSIGRV